ncbi:hypothetical protein FRC19_010033 [Serendipita sp. 401]|nr:hypothetical protein FRC19_010033 [Serendipita sp. 401]KAG9049429.1 hypothetical protein FS842_011529 [Serendipita sp. 407]
MSNEDRYPTRELYPQNLPTRSTTAAPSSSQHDMSSEASNAPKALSYRQLLQQRLQKYQFTATFHAEMTGPVRTPLWSGSFWLGSFKIGQSFCHAKKGDAKEEAAKEALNWLNTYGYH